ncbi:MAG TPA: hypothetical protein VGG39_17695 [Polyangiaceae bacterium]|jgi:hypothetical protein
MRAAAIVCALLAVAACDESGTQVVTRYRGTLTSEVIDTADVTLLLAADGKTVTVSLQFSNGYGFFDPSSPVAMTGRLDAYPESDLVAYAATLTIPPFGGGPCGDTTPVSLALSLVRRGGDAHVGGGLAAYCGAATYAGNPQRILRLQGDLPAQ